MMRILYGEREKQKIIRSSLPDLQHAGAATDEDFPFCSDRCRLIDLGKWASGAYRISSPILDPEVLEGLDEMHRSGRSSAMTNR